jgi:arylsulfatase A-like enzyme/Tfp pilus assembly protein PilF
VIHQKFFGWRGSALVFLLGVFLLGVSGCGKPQNPNAVLIILDTTRTDVLSCYDDKVGKTPNIDRLARTGAMFLDARAQNPYTLGSIATILTSLGPAIHGLRANSSYRLSPEALTLAEVFQEAGYSTAAFVSAMPISRQGGLDQGFDVYDDDFSTHYPIYDKQFEPLRESLQEAQRRGDETTRRVLDWLEGHPRNRPFFLMVHYFDPHAPYDPPPPFGDRFGPFKYAAEVAFTDSQVGRLLDALEDMGLSDRTVISLVADHAEAFGEHNEVGHGFLIYQTTLRVPWILFGRGIPKVRVRGTVALSDAAPTLLGACGLPIPESYEGMNLHSILVETGGAGSIEIPERGIYMDTYFSRHYHNWSELVGWSRGQWKYVRGPKPELFHLGRDPGEDTNLHDAEADTLQRLSDELDSYLRKVAPRRLKAASEAPDEETLERLKSLGYVGGAQDGEEFNTPGWVLDLTDPKDALVDWNQHQESIASFRLGLVSLMEEDFEKALEWADKSLDLAPNQCDALQLRCRALTKLGREREALPGYETLVRDCDDEPEIWFGYGLVLHKLSRWEEAGSAYGKALEMDPEHVQATINMGVVLVQQKRLEEALHYYEKARVLDPERTPQLVDLARLYLLLERFDDGKALLEEIVGRDPQNREALYILGLLLVEMGDHDGARVILGEYLKHHPDAPEAADVRQTLRELEGSS